MADKVTAKVKVTLAVEIEVGCWDSSTSFHVLRATAIKEAKAGLTNILGGNPRVRVISAPIAINVNLEERQ